RYPLPDVAHRVVYAERALRGGVRADLVREHRRGLARVGLVEVGVVHTDVLAGRVLAPVGPASGALPLELAAQARARDPAAGVEPREVGVDVGVVDAGHRQAQPVLRGAAAAIGDMQHLTGDRAGAGLAYLRGDLPLAVL